MIFSFQAAFNHFGWKFPLKLSTLCKQALSEGMNILILTVADPGGAEGAMAPPGPVKIGHKKDGCQRRLHRFHVSWPPLTRPLDPLL